MNYARNTDKLPPITCIDRVEQPIAVLILGVIEERRTVCGFASDEAATVQIFRNSCSLTCVDVELLGDLRGGETLRRTSPQQQQRFQVRHAVDLIDNKTVDLVRRNTIDCFAIAGIVVRWLVRHRSK